MTDISRAAISAQNRTLANVRFSPKMAKLIGAAANAVRFITKFCHNVARIACAV